MISGLRRLSRSLVLSVVLVSLLAAPLVAEAATGPLGKPTPPSLATAPQAGTFPGALDGFAYAGRLDAAVGSSVASVGPLFLVSLGCNSTPNTATASATSLTIGTNSITTGGSLTDQVVSTRSGTGASITSSSVIQNVNAFSGLITATTINAAVTSSADATSATSTGGATFVNLVVNGSSVSANPLPNTQISIPFGTVTLNAQVGPHNSPSATDMTVEAIVVDVTGVNAFGLAVGSKIVIGAAISDYQRTASATTVFPNALALYASALNGGATSGPWADAYTSCTGGTNTVTVTSANVPNVGSTGLMTDFVTGQVTATGGTATSSSTVNNVALLGTVPLITATAVRADASATLNGGVGTTSASTTLTGAIIAGRTIQVNPLPNTFVLLPLVGYVILNEQTKSIGPGGVSIYVNAMHIVITHTNILGLPIGAQIYVGHASAQVSAY